MPGTHWRQSRIRHGRLPKINIIDRSRKGIRHLGDKNYPLSTKSTGLNMFHFGDNVTRDTVDTVE